MTYAVEPSLIPKIKSDYIQGKGSVVDIARSYGITKTKPVEMRAYNEKWTAQRKVYLDRISEKALNKGQTEVDEWLKEVKDTNKAEWKYITASIKSLIDSGQGVDSQTIGEYVRARKLQDDMMRRSLGLVDPAHRVDVTTGGKSLGESLVDAIAKLREKPSESPVIDLTDEEIEVLRTAEIERTEPGK